MLDLNKSLDIVVVGGSLAALLTSIPLSRLAQRHKITILERSPTPLLHDQGAGIVAGSETLSWFQRHDRSDREGKVENISVLSRERLYLAKDGKVIDREGSEQRMTSWDLVYRTGRAGFDGVGGSDDGNVGSKGTDQRTTYAYGCTVKEVSDIGEKVKIKYIKKREGEEPTEAVMEADFLIVADGPSSNLRKLLLDELESGQRKYASYVAFRGTVPEAELSQAARDVFVEKFTFFHGHEPNTQTLAYTIPGAQGILEPGKRLVNWVWYWNMEEDSPEYVELMTDSDGRKHRFTLPTGGKMQKHVWDKQQDIAKERLPPQFAEIVTKTKNPFVQAITDLEPPEQGTRIGRLLDGKAVLVGDALSGFRPHTAASTSQAAFHGLLLEQVFLGKMSWDTYEERVLEFAWSWQTRGVMLGQRSQFGQHPLAARDGKVNRKVDRQDLWMRK